MIPPSSLSTDASFRSHAVNLVAVVPLLSSSTDAKTEHHHSYSEDSFHSLWNSLCAHEFATTTKSSDKADFVAHNLILTVPNSTLTRPGDWRYNNTPLKAFHWSHGCQRLNIFDGRINNRYSHDKLLKGQNHWSDLQTERRIAAVIGVLNMHDCPTQDDFSKALHELQNWAQRYSTPKYATIAHGKSLPRDTPIIRLFVYDSFDEAAPRIDLNQNPTIHSTNILAFPPTDESHAAMMDLHLNVVISDLTVGIFRDLETKISQLEHTHASNGGSSTTGGPSPNTTTASVKSKISRLVSGGNTAGSSGGAHDAGVDTEELSTTNATTSTTNVTQKKNTNSASLGLSNLADLVASDNLKTTSNSRKSVDYKNESNASLSNSATSASSSTSESQTTKPSQSQVELLTPLDDDMPPWDVANFHKRQVGRFIKLAADWCLLAGSPLDAYERYLRAAEFSKLTDAVWYAASLQGCAAAHVAMAEAGGYSVDEYLDVNFQLPDEIMNLAKDTDTNATTVTNKRQQLLQQQNKQTLPEVVIALSEEAIGIYRRQEQLAGLHAELLLKLAVYVAEQEGHWRCRWGEGKTCYAGEPNDVPRYQRSSVAKMQFQHPLKNVNGDDIISLHDLMRVRRVSEWLATAVSIGPLDPPTRVDVATRAAKLCLHGIELTKWSSSSGDKDTKLSSSIQNRMQLSRKAAYFTVVAAEALSVAAAMTSQNAASTDTAVASDLWFLATQLYSPSPNDASMMSGSYGWATLRAYCWDCLSKYGGSGKLALEAAGKLMSLLSELDPEIPSVESSNTKNAKGAVPMDERSRRSSSGMSAMDGEDDGDATSERRSSLGPFVDDENIQEKISSATTQLAKTLQTRYTNFTSSSASLTSGAAIPHHPFNQSKKLESEDDAFPSTVDVPLSESSSSISESVVNLRLVWPQMDYNVCFEAQTHCLQRTIVLRRSIPASSMPYDEAAVGSDPVTHDSFDQGESLPLFVSSAAAIQSGSKLELECVVKNRAATDESKQGAMATFFNPYENKRSDNNKIGPTRVAEEEEHAMLIRFGNRLSLPLEVQQSQLVFEDNGKVKAASLSFVIPAKAKSYSVNFPFTVLSKDTQSSRDETVAVKGLELTCFGRSFFLPIKELRVSRARANATPYNFPTPAFFYPLRLDKPKDSTSSETVNVAIPRIQAFPCQPRLQMFFADTGAPAEMLTVSLSDGEIFTVPTLKLRNYMGPSSKGKIECLEIIAVGLPGAPSKKIYESKIGPTMDDPEANFVHDLIFEASPPVLKIRTLKCSLHLDSVNASSISSDDDRANVTLQIAAAHNMCEKLIEGTTVVIQVRYRGLCSEHTEVWRKLEFSLRIVPSKGPRISSIAFRPDLSNDSALAELTSLFDSNKKSRGEKKTPSKTESISSLILQRTGLDTEMSVCDDNTYFVLTVANETRSVITLKKEDGAVGGFLEFPLAEISCRPGVSAKIPIVMPRVERVDENGNVKDVLSELITRTRLIWESHKGGETGPVRGRGHIRIPPACLIDIVNRQPSFIAHIATPPCAMHLFLTVKQTALPASADVIITSAVGKPIEVALQLDIASWVPEHVRSITNVSLEFCCARKCVNAEDDDNRLAVHRDFIWAGLLRQRLPLRDRNAEFAHRAKLVFCRSGTYVVSACAKFSRVLQSKDEDVPEEVWWAPTAQTIYVPELQHPA